MKNHLHYPKYSIKHDDSHNENYHFHSHNYKVIEKNKLLWSIYITGIVMFIEIIGGILSNSIALLSDAGHMFTHIFALLISYIAIILASCNPCHHRTFGLFRAEVLASLFNSIFLFIVTGFIIYESIKRLIFPENIVSITMFWVSCIGLFVNIITIGILHKVQKDDRNIKSAFLHMVSDLISSVVVVIGAVIINFTGLTFIDPIIGGIISVFILFWAWGLLKDSIRVLLEIAPVGMETDKIKDIIIKNDHNIVDVLDIHIVEITNGMYNFSAHIEIKNDSINEANNIICRINDLLREKFNINHTTIQVWNVNKL